MRPTPQPSEAPTEPQSLRQALDLLHALASGLREIARHAEKGISQLESRPLDGYVLDCRASSGPPRLLVDAATFTVNWNGQTCHLGYTVPFRLIVHLARNEGRYVAHQELLDEVWGGPRSASAVRSAMTDLRARLTRAGMKDLAEAIDGHNSGHYGLLLGQTPKTGTSD